MKESYLTLYLLIDTLCRIFHQYLLQKVWISQKLESQRNWPSSGLVKVIVLSTGGAKLVWALTFAVFKPRAMVVV